MPPEVTCVSIDPEKEELIPAVLAQLASRNIGIVLAEGGAQTLNSFIRLGLWDEAWVFQSKTAFIQDGLLPPVSLFPARAKKPLAPTDCSITGIAFLPEFSQSLNLL
ncbi:MAG: dihydrofolate reductase family protein [Haliscomenobacter sp.]|nr:dihydrofolate reductase family protein [Haliscomenobacter sp.]